MLTFYEVLQTCNDDLNVVAFLIAYFSNETNINKIVKNLEVSKINSYEMEINKILDLKLHTIKDLVKVHYDR